MKEQQDTEVKDVAVVKKEPKDSKSKNQGVVLDGDNSIEIMGMHQFDKKKFKEFDFDGVWRASIGTPETNFKCLIYGESGNGKTRFCVRLAKYVSQFKKVLYFSREEGISRTMQIAFQSENMLEASKRVVLGSKASFNGLMYYLKDRGKPDIIIIDSLDYMRLTPAQFKLLIDTYPKKSFIIVAWGKGEFPKSQFAKDIEFMCDIKIRVDQYVAYPRSRFGGNLPFIIWEQRVAERIANNEKAYPAEVRAVLECKGDDFHRIKMTSQDYFEEESFEEDKQDSYNYAE